jgi:hypothetical protein
MWLPAWDWPAWPALSHQTRDWPSLPSFSVPGRSHETTTFSCRKQRRRLSAKQCCGSVTFWYRTGSGFFCFVLLKATFTSFFKEKVIKKSQNSRNQYFSYYFCLMSEGSGSADPYIALMDPAPDPGDPPALNPDSRHWSKEYILYIRSQVDCDVTSK